MKPWMPFRFFPVVVREWVTLNEEKNRIIRMILDGKVDNYQLQSVTDKLAELNHRMKYLEQLHE